MGQKIKKQMGQERCPQSRGWEEWGRPSDQDAQQEAPAQGVSQSLMGGEQKVQIRSHQQEKPTPLRPEALTEMSGLCPQQQQSGPAVAERGHMITGPSTLPLESFPGLVSFSIESPRCVPGVPPVSMPQRHVPCSGGVEA